MKRMLSYRGCFASTDWNMFRDSSNNIEEITTSVTGFINKCFNNVIPTVTVGTYPNQNPWLTGNIRTELKARAVAFKKRDTMLIRNPATTSVEPSNRPSVNTGLRSNPTTLALMLVRCGRVCKLSRITKGNPAVSWPVTRAYQQAKCLLCSLRSKQH